MRCPGDRFGRRGRVNTRPANRHELPLRGHGPVRGIADGDVRVAGALDLPEDHRARTRPARRSLGLLTEARPPSRRSDSTDLGVAERADDPDNLAVRGTRHIDSDTGAVRAGDVAFDNRPDPGGADRHGTPSGFTKGANRWGWTSLHPHLP